MLGPDASRTQGERRALHARDSERRQAGAGSDNIHDRVDRSDLVELHTIDFHPVHFCLGLGKTLEHSQTEFLDLGVDGRAIDHHPNVAPGAISMSLPAAHDHIDMLCPNVAAPHIGHLQLERAAKLAPYDAYYLVRYAIASLATGKIVESIDALRSALEMDPRNRPYRVLLADAYLAAGLEEDATKILTSVGELDSYDMEFVGRRRLELNQAEMDAARAS